MTAAGSRRRAVRRRHRRRRTRRRFAHLAGTAHALAVAVHACRPAAELLAIGHDDAAVVLGVLQIVLRQHRVAGRLRVARERQMYFSAICAGVPRIFTSGPLDSKLRESGLWWPLRFVVIPAASAAILLSLPHCPNGSRLT